MHFHNTPQTLKAYLPSVRSSGNPLSKWGKKLFQSYPYEFIFHTWWNMYLHYNALLRTQTFRGLFNHLAMKMELILAPKRVILSFFCDSVLWEWQIILSIWVRRAHAHSIQYIWCTEKHYYPCHRNTNTSSLPWCHFLSFKCIQRKCQSFHGQHTERPIMALAQQDGGALPFMLTMFASFHHATPQRMPFHL